jgi:hypothetical protein
VGDSDDRPVPLRSLHNHRIFAVSTSRSAKAGAPDPGQYFSLAELAGSWAEVTGEKWESILHRLGDWAITDAFPDDAFLTDVATGTTFHKRVIFDRMRWHRDLLDKIHGLQDPKEKERLQKFADAHMRAAEIALVRREVVLEACRAMNVALPPILGLVAGVSAEHRAPPECPSNSPVGVFAREAERDQKLLRHRDVMPADKADGYTLLWDAAAQMSRANGRGLEWNWLRLMDAFWRGDLSPHGLVHFYRGRMRSGEFVVHTREELAGLLLGWRPLEDTTREPARPIGTLRLWAVADYLAKPAPFRAYFQNDPEGRFGLAVLTHDFDRWRKDRKSAVAKVSRRERPFWSDARAVAMPWLEENGYPQSGDGGQAALERHIADWLSRNEHASGEATVRRHVRSWIEEYRAEVGAGGTEGSPGTSDPV